MKVSLLMVLPVILALESSSRNPASSMANTEECTIEEFYKKITLADGSKSLSSYGTLQEVEVILSPITLDDGKYQVTLSRVGSNLYQVQGKDIYIETKLCSAYARGVEVFLIVERGYYGKKGKLIF